MSESNKSYRVRTKVGGDNSDKYVSVNLTQDFNTLEILSMKVDTTNFYKLQSSNYGCIAGRVLANGGVGVPNAKISIFIPADEETANDVILSELYPFATAFSKDSDGVRYNLFPNTEVKLCHTKIGTFPEKRLALDDEKITKVFEKYYKYTTRTNTAGDYMIFGVPVGEHVVHTDIDLSDIGILSQKPIDMVYKGYNITQFENPKKFKTDTNIDSLAQVISQNNSVDVFPFWGDESSQQVKITRNDIDLQYKFEPSCVFIGSLVTDDNSNGMQTACVPTDDMGKMSLLTTGYGTIEMIRKTPNGDVEEFTVQGNQLIDGNGTWCYQIPMNLDYYMTDEYGNMVPSDDTNKGIPTRTRVRFRVSLGNFKSDNTGIQIVKMLIPNNPHKEDEIDYHFGSLTKDDKFGTLSFRDLFWNNVYTVKSYIPRIQKSGWVFSKGFTGFKNVNAHDSNNPIPYNNMQVYISNAFTRQCNIFKHLLIITRFLNAITGKCAVIGGGMCPELENWYFSPGCSDKQLNNAIANVRTKLDKESIDEENKSNDSEEAFCVTNKLDYFVQCVEIHLAMENNVVQFNFFNDWINGLVYIPKWFVNLKKKTSYFFGAITTPARLQGCMESNFTNLRNFVQSCALVYKKGSKNMYTVASNPIGCAKSNGQRCHKAYGFKYKRIFGNNGGLIHTEQTINEKYVYYAKPAEWSNNGSHLAKCPLFATDIVMLGSLHNFDEVGIPNAFDELLPTTYRLPKTIAATNMDSAGYMYGVSGSKKGAKCSGLKTLIEPIQPYPQTFEGYAEWSKNSENNNSSVNEDSQNNLIEFPMTIASGIDWGYHGPDQGKNSFNDLYYPGGHFLGMSCNNTAVNIKSCVNLSRICEIGTTISQRHELVTGIRNDNQYELQYVNIIPSGLINRYDITNGNFRKMFASMNHNRLKTKINKDTAYLEYDIKPINPNGFMGELDKYVNGNNKYNGRVESDVDPEGNSSDTFVSTIETPDADYYRFRMGLQEDYSEANVLDKYLWRQSTEVAIPVYENSFYFYFGLKDGSTALDRFFKDFYAKCDTIDNDSSYVITETVNTKGCGQNGDDLGACEVWINDVDSPYTMLLKMNNPSSPYDTVLCLEEMSAGESSTPFTTVKYENNNRTTLTHNYSHFQINGLRGGKYYLTIASEGSGNVTVAFKIEENIPEEVDRVDLRTYDFEEKFSSFNEQYLLDRNLIIKDNKYAFDHDGYISIENVYGNIIAGTAIYTDSEYMIITRRTGDTGFTYDAIKTVLTAQGLQLQNMRSISFKSSWCIVDGEVDIESYYIPAWRGNDAYSVLFITRCQIPGKTGSSSWKTYAYNNQFISMKTVVDIYVGDSDLTWFNEISNIESHQKATTPADKKLPYNDWYSALLFCDKNELVEKLGLDINAGDSIIEKEKWNLKQSLYYRFSMYTDADNGDINVYPSNGTAPYTEFLSGKTEVWQDKTINSPTGSYTNRIKYNWDYSSYNGWKPTTSWERVETKENILSSRCNLSFDKDNSKNPLDPSVLHMFHTPTGYIGNEKDSNGKIKPYVRGITSVLFKGLSSSNFSEYAPSILYNGISIPQNFLKKYGTVTPSNVPHYEYKVMDSNEDKAPLDNGIYLPTVQLPSIYRPTYVNVRRLYYMRKTGGVEEQHIATSVSLVNPILFNNNVGLLKINGVDYTVPFNSAIEARYFYARYHETDYGVQDGFKRIAGSNGMYLNPEFINNKTPSNNNYNETKVYDHIISYWNIEQIVARNEDEYDNNTVTVEYEDGRPPTYDGVIPIMSITETRTCIFPSKNRPMYDMGVRFYVIDKDSSSISGAKNIRDTMHALAYYSLLLNDYTRTEFAIREIDNQSFIIGAWNGMFGGRVQKGNSTDTYNIVLKDITSDVYSEMEKGANEGERWKYFVNCARKANGLTNKTDAQNYNNVLAIYDKWTLAECSTNRDPRYMFKYVTPDENILSLVKYYSDVELYLDDYTI